MRHGHTVTAIAFRAILNAHIRSAVAERDAVLRGHVACRLARAEDRTRGRSIGVASEGLVPRVAGIWRGRAVVVVGATVGIVALRAGGRSVYGSGDVAGGRERMRTRYCRTEQRRG
jgi:hypothetical protein